MNKQSFPRSCGYNLQYNMICPKCGRAHYNPGKRKVCVRWGVGTRVRILEGVHAGKMGDVNGVNDTYVFVWIAVGSKKKPEFEMWRFLPGELRRSSGPMAHFP